MIVIIPPLLFNIFAVAFCIFGKKQNYNSSSRFLYYKRWINGNKESGCYFSLKIELNRNNNKN